MKLYYAEVFNPRRACAVAKYLEAPVEWMRVDLARGEHKQPPYLALNPNGKVPVLTDGVLRLWEADAIMVHLAMQAGSALWPSVPAAQVEAMRWLSWNQAHFLRHGGALYFEYVIKPWVGMGEADAAAVAEAGKFFRQFAAVLDTHLAAHEWLVGEQLGVADFAVSTPLGWAKEARLPLDGFEHIARWHRQLQALPAWREPFPAMPAAEAEA
ncbi:glutathione S-transferase family protein [Rhodanobacter sp. PCA2]|uniref:glutathione S-transferase family protein n=1 Tax=Rhodanobacter sp. PCA2 TaxID=2006117 RepID=UPI0015E7C12E|nr:glutathione S-transferase family protein [Rhodanobacter sp. PCA2]MBA2078951.1 glutathione S-transferase [Rhodanobacter sp. PCA2]